MSGPDSRLRLGSRGDALRFPLALLEPFNGPDSASGAAKPVHARFGDDAHSLLVFGCHRITASGESTWRDIRP
jgi:hypothetical protein